MGTTPYGSGVLCASTTGKGNQCLNPAKDSPYCPGHNPRNWCQAPTRKGPCRRRAKAYGGYCALHEAK